MLHRIVLPALLIVSVAFSQESVIVEDLDVDTGAAASGAADTGAAAAVPSAAAIAPAPRSGDPEYTREQLRDKLAAYTRLNNAGRTLLSVGIPLTLGGAVSYIAGIAFASSGEEAGVVFAMVGSIGMSLGPEIWIAGGVIHQIGKGKKAEYERRLKLCATPNSVRLCLDF